MDDSRDDICADSNVLVRMNQAVRGMERLILQHAAKPLGLTVTQWLAMKSLYFNNGQLAGQLARSVGRDRTGFTSVIDDLTRLGLVERRYDRNDRRVVYVFLTTQAEEKRETFMELANKVDSYIDSLFEARDMRPFRRIMNMLQSL